MMAVEGSEEALADWIVAQAADAVIFADADGIIRIWNAAAVAVFGFSASEALGHSLDLIVPEPMRRRHWAGFRQAIESGVTRLAGRATVTRALSKSGAALYVDLSFAVVRTPAGRVAGAVAIARDVTQRYLQEKQQRRARAG